MEPVHAQLDPASLAVISSRLNYIAWAMRDTMLMSSRSTALTVVQDFSTAIFDKNGNILVMPDLLPIQMCESWPTVQAIIEAYKGDIEPGDIFLNNSPYHGNTHAQEITVVCPVFYQDELLFWCMNRPHHEDVGGIKPSAADPYAKNIWEEGLYIPPIRAARNYKEDPHLAELILFKMRYKKLFRGDFLACMGSVWKGEKLLIDSCQKYGLGTIKQFIKEWIDYGDRRMTGEIKKLPRGSWSVETMADDPLSMTSGIYLKLKTIIDPDESTITFDMTKCQDQVPCGINLTRSSAKASCLEGLMACLDPSLPRCWGTYRHVKYIQREGSVCHPRWPASTCMATVWLADRLANLVFRTFAEISPERGHSECGAEGCAQAVLAGKDFRKNYEDYAAGVFTANAGGPASMGYDGWPGFMSLAVMGVMLFESVELHEVRRPHIVLEESFPPDSGGYGKWRGGPGCYVSVKPRRDPMQVFPFGDGLVYPAAGVLGGGSGMKSSHWITDAKTGKVIQELGRGSMYEIKPSQVWCAIACGAGGFGNPLERDPEKVRWDAREEIISLKCAEQIYGVVLNTETETYEVDYEATKNLRESLKNRK